MCKCKRISTLISSIEQENNLWEEEVWRVQLQSPSYTSTPEANFNNQVSRHWFKKRGVSNLSTFLVPIPLPFPLLFRFFSAYRKFSSSKIRYVQLKESSRAWCLICRNLGIHNFQHWHWLELTFLNFFLRKFKNSEVYALGSISGKWHLMNFISLGICSASGGLRCPMKFSRTATEGDPARGPLPAAKQWPHHIPNFWRKKMRKKSGIGSGNGRGRVDKMGTPVFAHYIFCAIVFLGKKHPQGYSHCFLHWKLL